MEKEVWKKIKGFKDYEVSSNGRIKSFKFGKEKILKQSINQGKFKVYGRPYKKVGLNKNKKGYSFEVHRLVAFVFCKGYSKGKEVDHLDGDSLNNNYKNLKWVTKKENMNNPNNKKPKRIYLNEEVVEKILELYKKIKTPKKILNYLLNEK